MTAKFGCLQQNEFESKCIKKFLLMQGIINDYEIGLKELDNRSKNNAIESTKVLIFYTHL